MSFKGISSETNDVWVWVFLRGAAGTGLIGTGLLGTALRGNSLGGGGPGGGGGGPIGDGGPIGNEEASDFGFKESSGFDSAFDLDS